MQHMDKGSIKLALALTLFFVLYLANIFHDHKYFNDNGVSKIIDDRLEYLQENSNKFDGLIIGGSNALWGLSAQNLSSNTEYSFYNLAMHSNGVNFKEYFNYISESIPKNSRESIKLIIWSTIFTFKEPPYNDFDRDITGRLKLPNLYPNTSFMNRAYDYFQASNEYGFSVKKGSGDFDFNKFRCNFDSVSKEFNLKKLLQHKQHFYGDNDAFKEQVLEYKKFFQTSFPNAKVIFVIPSLFNPPNLLPEQLKNLNDFLNFVDMHLYFQPEINYDLLCDDWHHPNFNGRAFRSLDLSDFLNSENGL